MDNIFHDVEDTSIFHDTENTGEGWIIPPTTSDTAPRHINKAEAQAAAEHPFDTALAIPKGMAKVAGDIAQGAAETIAYGPTATLNKINEGYTRMLTVLVNELHTKAYGKPLWNDQEAEAIANGAHILPEKPSSQTGKGIAEGVGKVMELPAKAGNMVADMLDSAGAPKEVGYGVRVASEAAPWMLGLKVGSKAGEELKPKEVPPTTLPSTEARTFTQNIKAQPDRVSHTPIETNALGPNTSIMEVNPENTRFSTIIRDTTNNGIGTIDGRINKTTNTLSIDNFSIPDIENQGQGHGTRALADLISRAADNNMKVESPTNITTAQASSFIKAKNSVVRINVERNPNTITNIPDDPNQMVTYSTKDNSPVYTTYPVKNLEDFTPKEIKQARDQALQISKARVKATKEETIRRSTAWTEDTIEPAPLKTKEEDNRSAPDLVNSLIKTEQVNREDGSHTLVHKATTSDLPDRYSADNRYVPFKGNYLAPAFTAAKNAIVRWTNTLINKEDAWINKRKDDLLYESTAQMSKGRPVRVPSNDAIIPRLREVAKDEAHSAFLLRTIKDYDLGADSKSEIPREVLENKAKDAGLDPTKAKHTIDTYYKLRQVIDAAPANVIKMSDVFRGLGVKGVDYVQHPGYFPRIWEGDYATFAKDSNGNVVETSTANTSLGASMNEKALQDKYGKGITVSSVKRKPVSNDNAAEVIANLIGRAERAGESGAVNFLESQQGVTGARVHGLKREQNAKGYLGDPDTFSTTEAMDGTIKALETFVHGMTRTESAMRIQFQMDHIMSDPAMQKLYPNALKWSNDYVNDYLGRKPVIDKAIEEHIAPLFGIGGGAIKKVMSATGRTMTRLNILAFNLVQIGQQPLQYMNTLAKTAGLAKGSEVPAWKLAMMPFKTFYDMHIGKTSEMLDVMKTASDNGAIDPNFTRFLQEDEFAAHGESRFGAKEFIKNVDKLAFGYLDEVQRAHSIGTIYSFFRESGVDHATAKADAISIGNRMSVDMSAAETPNAFRGSSGAFIGQWQRWGMNNMGQLLEATKSAVNDNNWRHLAALVAGTTAIGGMTGLWGVQDADTITEFTNSHGLTNSQLPSAWLIEHNPVASVTGSTEITQDMLNFGVIQGWTGAYFTAVNSPNMVRNWLNAPRLTYMKEIASSVTNLVTKSISGTVTPLDKERALLSVAPNLLKEPIRRAFEKPDFELSNPNTWLVTDKSTYISHSLKSGTALLEIDSKQSLYRSFGVKSTDEAILRYAYAWQKSVEDGRKVNLQDWANYVAVNNALGSNIDTTKMESFLSEQGIIPSEFMKEVKKSNDRLYKTIETNLLNVKRAMKNKGEVANWFINEKDNRSQPANNNIFHDENTNIFHDE